MGAPAVGGIVFFCLSLAAAIGMFVRVWLPDHHLSVESKDVIKLATAVVGTLSALALGFLIASAKTAHDGAEAELRTSVAQLLLLDRVMEQYGPQTEEARRLLRDFVQARVGDGWGHRSDDGVKSRGESYNLGIELVQEKLRALSPETDAHRWLQSRALEVSGHIAEAHWLLVEPGAEELPGAFLGILVFWLGLLFFTFGLLAPSNGTVACILVACALSVAGAVFLTMDMAHPYAGFIHVSDAPLRTALDYLGRS